MTGSVLRSQAFLFRGALVLFLAVAPGCAPQGMAPPSDLSGSLPTDGTGDGRKTQRPPALVWLPQSVGYEIFVRSFADSDKSGDGDLPGITARLNYLQDLGVDLIWLTPIHPSPSYHGYDVLDYDAVNPDFGTLSDLDRLLSEAHRRGMRVLLDLVANHTSNKHPWFLAAEKDAPTSGPEAGRYLFRGSDPGWPMNSRHYFKPVPDGSGRFFFSFFSGALPDLNYRDPRVLPAIKDVVSLWIGRGADGFRLDAARYLEEWPDPISATSEPAVADTADTHKTWRALRETAVARDPGAALIGEVWADMDTIAQYRGGGDELHGCFHFPLAGAMLDGVNRGDPGPIRDALSAMARTTVPASFLAPFLSNHDQQRSATVLQGKGARMRQAAALLLALPGPPFLYYGEEIGMEQSTDPKLTGDRAQRAPMPWDTVTAQRADAGSLLNHYRKLIRLRRATPALSSDLLRVLTATDGRLLALQRGGSQGVAAVYNLSDVEVAGAHVELPADYALGPQKDLLAELPAAAAAADAGNRGRYPLPAIPARGAVWITGG